MPIGGMIDWSITTGPSVIPSIFGIEKPQMSASITPTFLPRRLKAIARLVVTDDFPTPPLPEETAITLVGEPPWPTLGPPESRRRVIIAVRASSSMTVVSTVDAIADRSRDSPPQFVGVRIVGYGQRDQGLESCQQTLVDLGDHRQFTDASTKEWVDHRLDGASLVVRNGHCIPYADSG